MTPAGDRISTASWCRSHRCRNLENNMESAVTRRQIPCFFVMKAPCRASTALLLLCLATSPSGASDQTNLSAAAALAAHKSWTEAADQVELYLHEHPDSVVAALLQSEIWIHLACSPMRVASCSGSWRFIPIPSKLSTPLPNFRELWATKLLPRHFCSVAPAMPPARPRSGSASAISTYRWDQECKRAQTR